MKVGFTKYSNTGDKVFCFITSTHSLSNIKTIFTQAHKAFLVQLVIVKNLGAKNEQQKVIYNFIEFLADLTSKY